MNKPNPWLSGLAAFLVVFSGVNLVVSGISLSRGADLDTILNRLVSAALICGGIGLAIVGIVYFCIKMDEVA